MQRSTYLHSRSERARAWTTCAFALVFGVFGLVGCSDRSTIEKELASLKTEVASLRAREGALTERLESLERASIALGLASTAANGSDRPDLEIIKQIGRAHV